jgi:hypothetical protein
MKPTTRARCFKDAIVILRILRYAGVRFAAIARRLPGSSAR